MSLNRFDLSGRNALVTGSSRGIGLALARGLAQAGAQVMLNGRDPIRTEIAAAALRDDGLAVQACVFDVTDPDRVADGMMHFEARMGAMDILVNNAGIQRRTPLLQAPEVRWSPSSVQFGGLAKVGSGLFYAASWSSGLALSGASPG